MTVTIHLKTEKTVEGESPSVFLRLDSTTAKKRDRVAEILLGIGIETSATANEMDGCEESKDEPGKKNSFSLTVSTKEHEISELIRILGEALTAEDGLDVVYPANMDSMDKETELLAIQAFLKGISAAEATFRASITERINYLSSQRESLTLTFQEELSSFLQAHQKLLPSDEKTSLAQAIPEDLVTAKAAVLTTLQAMQTRDFSEFMAAANNHSFFLKALKKSGEHTQSDPRLRAVMQTPSNAMGPAVDLAKKYAQLAMDLAKQLSEVEKEPNSSVFIMAEEIQKSAIRANEAKCLSLIQETFEEISDSEITFMGAINELITYLSNQELSFSSKLILSVYLKPYKDLRDAYTTDRLEQKGIPENLEAAKEKILKALEWMVRRNFSAFAMGINNQPAFAKYIQDIIEKENSKDGIILKQMIEEAGTNLPNMLSNVITIVQRAPRYNLFAKELLVHFSKADEDNLSGIQEVSSVVEKLKGVGSSLNDATSSAIKISPARIIPTRDAFIHYLTLLEAEKNEDSEDFGGLQQNNLQQRGKNKKKDRISFHKEALNNISVNQESSAVNLSSDALVSAVTALLSDPLLLDSGKPLCVVEDDVTVNLAQEWEKICLSSKQDGVYKLSVEKIEVIKGCLILHLEQGIMTAAAEAAGEDSAVNDRIKQFQKHQKQLGKANNAAELLLAMRSLLTDTRATGVSAFFGQTNEFIRELAKEWEKIAQHFKFDILDLESLPEAIFQDIQTIILSKLRKLEVDLGRDLLASLGTPAQASRVASKVTGEHQESKKSSGANIAAIVHCIKEVGKAKDPTQIQDALVGLDRSIVDQLLTEREIRLFKNFTRVSQALASPAEDLEVGLPVTSATNEARTNLALMHRRRENKKSAETKSFRPHRAVPGLVPRTSLNHDDKSEIKESRENMPSLTPGIEGLIEKLRALRSVDEVIGALQEFHAASPSEALPDELVAQILGSFPSSDPNLELLRELGLDEVVPEEVLSLKELALSADPNRPLARMNSGELIPHDGKSLDLFKKRLSQLALTEESDASIHQEEEQQPRHNNLIEDAYYETFAPQTTQEIKRPNKYNRVWKLNMLNPVKWVEFILVLLMIPEKRAQKSTSGFMRFLRKLYSTSLQVLRVLVKSSSSSLTSAGLSLMLGFAIFASSVNFGLAEQGEILMTGLLADPLAVFALTVLAIAFLSHLVMRGLKYSVIDIPICKAMSIAPEAKKILQAYTEDLLPNTAESFSKALSVYIEDAVAFLHPSWRDGICHYADPGADFSLEDDLIFLQEIQTNLETNFTLTAAEKERLTEIFTRIEKATVNPNYRPKFSRYKIAGWSLLSMGSLVACVYTLGVIFTSGATFGINGMAWSISAAVLSGLVSWLSTQHVLDKISGDSYLRFTALLGAGAVIFGTLGIFFSTAALELSSPVIMATVVSLSLLSIVCGVITAVRNKVSSAKLAEKVAPLGNKRTVLHGIGIIALLALCVVPLSFMLAPNPSFLWLSNPWLILLAIPSGFACLAFTDHALNRLSKSPFATSAAFSIIALLTIAWAWVFTGIGFSTLLTVLASSLGGLLLVSGVFLYRDKHKITQRAGQEGERLLRTIKLLFIVGFLFLAFLSIATMLNFYGLEPLLGSSANNFLHFALNVISGKASPIVGNLWLVVFSVGVFTISCFAIISLLKSLMERTPAKNVETTFLEDKIAEFEEDQKIISAYRVELMEQVNNESEYYVSNEGKRAAPKETELSQKIKIIRGKYPQYETLLQIETQLNALKLEQQRLQQPQQQKWPRLQKTFNNAGPFLLNSIFVFGLMSFLSATSSIFFKMPGAETSLLFIFLAQAVMTPLALLFADFFAGAKEGNVSSRKARTMVEFGVPILFAVLIMPLSAIHGSAWGWLDLDILLVWGICSVSAHFFLRGFTLLRDHLDPTKSVKGFLLDSEKKRVSFASEYPVINQVSEVSDQKNISMPLHTAEEKMRFMVRDIHQKIRNIGSNALEIKFLEAKILSFNKELRKLTPKDCGNFRANFPKKLREYLMSEVVSQDDLFLCTEKLIAVAENLNFFREESPITVNTLIKEHYIACAKKTGFFDEAIRNLSLPAEIQEFKLEDRRLSDKVNMRPLHRLLFAKKKTGEMVPNNKKLKKRDFSQDITYTLRKIHNDDLVIPLSRMNLFASVQRYDQWVDHSLQGKEQFAAFEAALCDGMDDLFPAADLAWDVQLAAAKASMLERFEEMHRQIIKESDLGNLYAFLNARIDSLQRALDVILPTQNISLELRASALKFKDDVSKNLIAYLQERISEQDLHFCTVKLMTMANNCSLYYFREAPNFTVAAYVKQYYLAHAQKVGFFDYTVKTFAPEDEALESKSEESSASAEKMQTLHVLMRGGFESFEQLQKGKKSEQKHVCGELGFEHAVAFMMQARHNQLFPEEARGIGNWQLPTEGRVKLMAFGKALFPLPEVFAESEAVNIGLLEQKKIPVVEAANLQDLRGESISKFPDIGSLLSQTFLPPPDSQSPTAGNINLPELARGEEVLYSPKPEAAAHT